MVMIDRLQGSALFLTRILITYIVSLRKMLGSGWRERANLKKKKFVIVIRASVRLFWDLLYFLL